MKRILFIAFLLLPSSLLVCGKNPVATAYAGGYLQYDGVYACYDEGGDMPATQYYRFYPDNTVIEVASTGSLTQIQRWFKKGSTAEFGRGRITRRDGNKISFYTRYGINGKQFKYTAEIDGNLIRLKESRWLWGKETVRFVLFDGQVNIPNCR